MPDTTGGGGAGVSRGAPAGADARPDREHVTVWAVELDLPPDALAAALALMSPDERALASRLKGDAPRWVAARAALRRILATPLGVAPSEVAFAAGPHGKPALAPGAHPDIRFSLSHSGALALIAVRVGHEVGVDVEVPREGVDGEAIARELFSGPERAVMAALEKVDPARAFFRTWVCHEALAKATGRGVAGTTSAADAERFTVRELEGLPGYVAAVASEGDAWSVTRAERDPGQ
jgi:4'-phosphopantetheinyl transferase